MDETSLWLLDKEAIEVLCVEEQILNILREEGFLKPGDHWRSSNEHDQLPWKPKAFYLVSGCKEVLEYFQDNEVLSRYRAA